MGTDSGPRYAGGLLRKKQFKSAVARQEAARTGYSYGGTLLEGALKKRSENGK